MCISLVVNKQFRYAVNSIRFIFVMPNYNVLQY